MFLRPTLGFKLGLLDVGTFAEYTWLLNTNGFHLGLSYGMILDFNGGLAGWAADHKNIYTGNTTSDSEGYGKTSVDMKIYLGLCLNFGDRGIDR